MFEVMSQFSITRSVNVLSDGQIVHSRGLSMFSVMGELSNTRSFNVLSDEARSSSRGLSMFSVMKRDLPHEVLQCSQ